jgi:hypothetical protein
MNCRVSAVGHRQAELNYDVDLVVRSAIRLAALDSPASAVMSPALDDMRNAYLGQETEEIPLVFNAKVAVAMTRMRLAAAATDDDRKTELKILSACLVTQGVTSMWASQGPVMAVLLTGIVDWFEHRDTTNEPLVDRLRATSAAADHVANKTSSHSLKLVEEAVDVYRELLALEEEAGLTLDVALTKRSLAGALTTLAEHRDGTTELEEADTLYMSCIDTLKTIGLDSVDSALGSIRALYKPIYGDMRASLHFLGRRKENPSCKPDHYYSDEW